MRTRCAAGRWMTRSSRMRCAWCGGCGTQEVAHRDIKPSNVLVRDGKVLLIDVAFAAVRPTPWRQAVDLANMMLTLALLSTPERVYERALEGIRGAGRGRGVRRVPERHGAHTAPGAGPRRRARPGRAVPPARPQHVVPMPVQLWNIRRVGVTAIPARVAGCRGGRGVRRVHEGGGAAVTAGRLPAAPAAAAGAARLTAGWLPCCSRWPPRSAAALRSSDHAAPAAVQPLRLAIVAQSLPVRVLPALHPPRCRRDGARPGSAPPRGGTSFLLNSDRSPGQPVRVRLIARCASPAMPAHPRRAPPARSPTPGSPRSPPVRRQPVRRVPRRLRELLVRLHPSGRRSR